MKRVLPCIMLVVLVACTSPLGERPEVLEENLSQYPHWFFDEKGGFNGVIILDANAEEADRENTALLIDNLRAYDSTMDESLLRMYPTSLSESNAVLIGSCSQEPPNKWANLYLDCVSMLEDQALIKIVDHHGVWLFLILGYDTERTRDAIEMLSLFDSYPLEGQVMEVVRDGDAFKVGVPR